MSVVEEIIGFREGGRTPSPAGRGQQRRSAGGRSRTTRGQI